MSTSSPASNVVALRRFRTIFKTRDFFFQDGAALRRVRLTARAQFFAAVILGLTFFWAVFSAVQLVAGTSALNAAEHRQVQISAMEGRIAAMRAHVEQRAERLEQRQAFLAAVLTDRDDKSVLAAMTDDKAGLSARFRSLEERQRAFAEAALGLTNARYAETEKLVRALGLKPARLQRGVVAMGGPFEPVDARNDGKSDPEFRNLFASWQKLEQLEQGVMAIPSQKPVANLVFTSMYGVRSDPFRGSAAMHAGVDIPGPIGTPIYATADGIVGRAQWVGGYGKYIEINHGKGIQTRYGHMSELLVAANSRVKRGDLIGRMGSTGRSTGSHLHYEVRIDGRAVNPIPFLQSSDYLLAVQERASGMTAAVAQGGPED